MTQALSSFHYTVVQMGICEGKEECDSPLGVAITVFLLLLNTGTVMVLLLRALRTVTWRSLLDKLCCHHGDRATDEVTALHGRQLEPEESREAAAGRGELVLEDLEQGVGGAAGDDVSSGDPGPGGGRAGAASAIVAVRDLGSVGVARAVGPGGNALSLGGVDDVLPLAERSARKKETGSSARRSKRDISLKFSLFRRPSFQPMHKDVRAAMVRNRHPKKLAKAAGSARKEKEKAKDKGSRNRPSKRGMPSAADQTSSAGRGEKSSRKHKKARKEKESTRHHGKHRRKNKQ